MYADIQKQLQAIHEQLAAATGPGVHVRTNVRTAIHFCKLQIKHEDSAKKKQQELADKQLADARALVDSADKAAAVIVTAAVAEAKAPAAAAVKPAGK